MDKVEIFKKTLEANNRKEIIRISRDLIKCIFNFTSDKNDLYKNINLYYSIIAKLNYNILLDIPTLYLAYCRILKNLGKIHELKSILEDSEKVLNEQEKKECFWDSHILLLKSYLDSDKNKYYEALEKLQNALAKLSDFSEYDLLSVINYAIASNHYYLFNINKSLVYYKKAEYYILNDQNNSAERLLRLKTDIVYCLFFKNKLNECFDELSKIELFIKENNLNKHPYLLFYYDILASVLFYKNEKDLLLECIDKITSLFEDRSVLPLFMSYINITRSLILLNELEKAKSILDKIESYFKSKEPPNRVRLFLYLLNLIFAKKSNDFGSYTAWLNEICNINIDENYYVESGVSILLAYSFLENNNINEAEKLYQKTIDFFSEKDSELFKFKSELLKIAIEYKKGNKFKSILNLKEKLFFSQKDWNIGIYLESSDIILTMINEIYTEAVNKKSIIDLKYLEDITYFIGNNLKFTLNLSEKEIEILKLVNKGLANKEIAVSLYISINTLKTHIRNINRKLGVENKEEALIKAKEYIVF